MPKEKRQRRKDRDDKGPDKSSENPADQSKRAESASDKKQKPAAQKPAVDLNRLRKTTTTQAPRVPSARDLADDDDEEEESLPVKPISQTRKDKAKDGPDLDLKFAVIGFVAVMLLGLVTHIFGINANLVLNDRFKLSFLFNQELMQQASENVFRDMISHPLMQPWTFASFIGDYGEYKTEFIWYHAVNVFWHAFNCGLVFAFVLTLCRHLHFQNRLRLNPYYLATATAALFACHPLASQTVTYLSARSILLGTNNFLLTLNFVLLGILVKHTVARTIFLFLALSTGAMAAWSNPEMIALPAVAAFSILLIKRPLSRWSETYKEHPIALSTCFAFSVLLPAATVLGIRATDAINYYSPALDSVAYAASQFKAFTFYYLRSFIFPLGLTVDPPLAIANGMMDPFAIAGAAILLLLAFVLCKIKREPILGLAVILVLAGFIPHGFMLQRDVVADWVAYLPLVGVSIFAGWGIASVAQKRLRNGLILLACLVVLFADLSIWRDWQWGSNFRLWKSALECRPKSSLAHAMISMQYLRRMQFDLAEKEAKLALAYDPDQVMARIAEAKVEMYKRNPIRAMEILASAKALAEKQGLPRAIALECELNKLQCLIVQKRIIEANLILQKLAVELPEDPRLVFLVGYAAMERREYEAAFKILQSAVSKDPSLGEAWEPMIRAAMQLRLYEQAYVAAHDYARHHSGPEVRMLLARAALINKRTDEAEQILKELDTQETRNARVKYLLSRLYKRAGKTYDWQKYRDDAVKIDADVAANYDLPELDLEDAITIPQQ